MARLSRSSSISFTPLEQLSMSITFAYVPVPDQNRFTFDPWFYYQFHNGTSSVSSMKLSTRSFRQTLLLRSHLMSTYTSLSCWNYYSSLELAVTLPSIFTAAWGRRPEPRNFWNQWLLGRNNIASFFTFWCILLCDYNQKSTQNFKETLLPLEEGRWSEAREGWKEVFLEMLSDNSLPNWLWLIGWTMPFMNPLVSLNYCAIPSSFSRWSQLTNFISKRNGGI